MATLVFNAETFEYKDMSTEKIDKKTGKPFTTASIMQTREFIPVGQGLFQDKRVYFYWHHYKASEYTEIIQILATVSTGTTLKAIGQIQILAYRNLVARRYQFPVLGFSYSQNKIDLGIYNAMLKYTQITKYEQFHNPNGLQAVIVQFDVMQEYRKKHIGSALLYLAGLQIDPSVPLYLDKTPYTPIEPLQILKAKHNLSPFSIGKIYVMCERLGFRAEKAPSDEQIAVQQIDRLILDRKAPIDARGVNIRYQTGLDNFKYRLSKDIKSQV